MNYLLYICCKLLRFREGKGRFGDLGKGCRSGVPAGSANSQQQQFAAVSRGKGEIRGFGKGLQIGGSGRVGQLITAAICCGFERGRGDSGTWERAADRGIREGRPTHNSSKLLRLREGKGRFGDLGKGCRSGAPRGSANSRSSKLLRLREGKGRFGEPGKGCRSGAPAGSANS